MRPLQKVSSRSGKCTNPVLLNAAHLLIYMRNTHISNGLGDRTDFQRATCFLFIVGHLWHL
jgi:hypothetical protein